MTRLEKLLMRVELIDKVTAPVNKIMGTLDKLTQSTTAGFVNIAGGVGGLLGVGYAMQSVTGSAREMNKAMASVDTLSIGDAALKKLKRTALDFSVEYGESAAEFVSSSYKIQSAISSLKGDELMRFTNAANILAKGTLADAETMTSYIGLLYNVFSKDAEKIGKAQWVDDLAGKTAYAVKVFNTDGKKMAASFATLGSTAAGKGIGLDEQIAILGTLQNLTAGGEQAATQYNAFLRGVYGAQEKLGLTFLDSGNNILPIVKILDLIKGKYGDLDEVELSTIASTFGDEGSKFFANIFKDVDGLRKSIVDIGNIKGMDKARQMAEKMIDPMERMNKATEAVKIGFGSLVLDALLPYYNSSADNLAILGKWIDKYPHLFGALAKLTVFIFGVVAVVSLLAIAKGAAMIAVAGFSVALTILKTPLLLIRAATWAWTASLWFARVALLATAIRFPALITGLIAMKAGFISGAAGAWAFAAALLANPITWIVLAVVGLVAGLVWMATHWDLVKSSAVGAITWILEKWRIFRAVIEDNPILKHILQPMLDAADFVGFLINNLEKIPAWFTSFKDWLKNLNVFDVLMAPAKLALDTLNLLPGVNIDTSKLSSVKQPPMPAAAQTATQLPVAPNPVPVPLFMKASQPANDSLFEKVERDREQMAPPPAAPIRNVPAGGLMQQFNNSNTQNRGNTIGTLNVNTTQSVNGYSLNDQLLMAGG